MASRSSSAFSPLGNISSVCVMCYSNVGKGGQCYRGRRCLNTYPNLKELIRKVDKIFYDGLTTFAEVRTLHVCTSCVNKLNRFETKLNQAERLDGQISVDRRSIKETLETFKVNYLPHISRGKPESHGETTIISSRGGASLGSGQVLTPMPAGSPSSSLLTDQFSRTPRGSSKIPRRFGFSPFTMPSRPFPSGPSPSKIPVRRKTPGGQDGKKNTDTARSHSAAKRLFTSTEEASMDVAGFKVLDDDMPLETRAQHHPIGTSHSAPQSSKAIHCLAKIIVKYGETERTRYLDKTEEECVSICRGIVKGGQKGSTQVANAVISSDKFRTLVQEQVLQDINRECTDLCSILRPTLLRDISPRHLNHFQLKKIVEEWQNRAPLFFSVLSRMLMLSHQCEMSDADIFSTAGVGASILFARCQQLSAIHHAIGLLLDFGGAKNKTISALSKCGLSVAPVTVYRQRKALENYHDNHIMDTLTKKKTQIVAAAVSSVPCLKLPVYSLDSSNVNIIQHMLTLGLFSRDPTPTPSFVNWDIYGDNLDYTIKTFRQTITKRGEDLHWFLLVGSPLRVVSPATLDKTRPNRDVTNVQNMEFLPSAVDHDNLKKHLIFHVLEVMTQYCPFLEDMRDIIPTHIPHPHVKEMAVQSSFTLLDILDKSENKNDEMIDILNHVHDNYVPFIAGAMGENVMERLVFGGDQLTNERAYSAQLNMANGTNESSKLMGTIHRTEGLHLCMNFCRFILESFYSSTSVRDCGTLYHLKTLVDRRGITLDMTAGYNQAKHLIDDVLDAHILAAVMDHFGMASLGSTPSQNVQDLLQARRENKLQVLSEIAGVIIDKYVLAGQERTLGETLQQIDEQRKSLGGKPSKKFMCNVEGCSKSFSTAGWLKRHMKNKHGIALEAVTVARRMESDENYDGVRNYASSFIKAALLFRDLRDAYKMGDGDRLFLDFKFLMLYFDQSTHVKYRLWMWRMLAYDLALLSEHERYNYRWNMSVNISGGIRRCIANDNLVEIHVHKVKEIMRSMGANVTYAAVRRACKCLTTVQCLEREMGSYVSGKHAEISQHKTEDIQSMLSCLLENKNLVHQPTREHANFPNFSSSLLSSVDLVALNQWLNDQKVRAAREMQV